MVSYMGGPLDGALPCTATTKRPCQIVHCLSRLNEILFQAQMELREIPRKPAELTILSSRYPSLVDPGQATQGRLAMLLYILIKRHHCVKEIEVNISTLNSYDAFLCDALRGNEHIEILKIHAYIERGPISHPVLSHISSLNNLKHFECTTYVVCSEELLEALLSLLRSSKTLESLHIPNVEIYMDSTALLTAIIGHPSLKQLYLNVTVLEFTSVECCEAFTVSLNNSSTLTRLGFAGECHYGASTCSKVILRGLCENRSILEFEMEEMLADEDVTDIVATIFAQNTVLRRFHISRGMGCLLLLEGGNCAGWLPALIGNETLEELTLPFDIWWPHQWREFIAALSEKHSLKKVTIFGHQADDTFILELCEAVCRSGVEEKVQFGPSFNISDFRSFGPLRCKSFVDIFASTRIRADALLLHGLVSELSSLTHVASLSLGTTPHASNKDLSSALSNYIGATTTLKKLCLNFYSDAQPEEDTNICWTTIIEAMTTNRSISELRIQTDFVKREEIEYLADVIRRSENIRRACVWVPRGQLLDTFLVQLSRGIGSNYALVSIEVQQHMAQDSFAVFDTARRNSSLVARALHFQNGAAIESITAGALERVYRHRALLEEFADAESMSLLEAETALKVVVKTFEDLDAFMRLAGVVRVSVVCHVQHDGRMQLDDLNADCWRALRRYLFLDDVVIPAPHACLPQ